MLTLCAKHAFKHKDSLIGNLQKLANIYMYSNRANFIPSHASFTSYETEMSNTKVSTLFDALCKRDRSALACAITMVESQHPKMQQSARFLLSLALADSRRRYETEGKSSLSFRIGLTGPPGAGKSTFIECLGKTLTSEGHKVAVLAVDPSSSTTGGSLLGDKTRMPELSRDLNAYIRPSPSSGVLGGVTRSTNEAIALCECAGYDIIMVETVGVGQSEYKVSHMVDMFAMIVSPGGGDELQGLKKGIVELTDIVIVNKSDGDLIPSARRIQADYTSALKFVRRRFKVWRPLVVRVSSQTLDGVPNFIEEMFDFRDRLLKTGDIEAQRARQYKMWMWLHIENGLLDAFKKHPDVKTLVSDIERKVECGVMTPGQASDILMRTFSKS